MLFFKFIRGQKNDNFPLNVTRVCVEVFLCVCMFMHTCMHAYMCAYFTIHKNVYFLTLVGPEKTATIALASESIMNNG